MPGLYLHLHIASEIAKIVWPDEGIVDISSLFSGTVAPDVLFFPRGNKAIGDALHREYLEMDKYSLTAFKDDSLYYFYMGWHIHMKVDTLLHPHVDRLSAKFFGPPNVTIWTYGDDPLAHQRIEWGMDCVILSKRNDLPNLHLKKPSSSLLKSMIPHSAISTFFQAWSSMNMFKKLAYKYWYFMNFIKGNRARVKKAIAYKAMQLARSKGFLSFAGVLNPLDLKDYSSYIIELTEKAIKEIHQDIKSVI